MTNQQFAKKANRKKRYRKLKGKGLNPKQKEEVQKLITTPVEKKYYDYALDGESIQLTPSFYDISDPAEGTASNEMIGDSMNFINLSYKFHFRVADTTNFIRFVIFQWYADNATDTPQWNQIFQFHTAGNPTDQYELMSPYVIGSGNKAALFKILIDEQFYLDADNSVQMIEGFINKGVRKRIGNLAVPASPSTGTNKIYLMLVSDSGAVSHPVLHGWSRLRFTDS